MISTTTAVAASQVNGKGYRPDRGQVIYVSPAHGVVIVRNGYEYGITLSEWTAAFYSLAENL